MKKVLVGCGVVILIVFAIIGFLIYQGVQMGKSFVSGMEETQKQFSALNAQYPFKSPADGIVTEEQMQKWIAVRQEDVAPVQKLSDKFQANTTKNPFTFLNEVMELFREVARSHVAILGTHRMSMNEYAWITKTVLGVLNSGDGRSSAKLKPVVEKINQMDNRSKGRNSNMMVMQHAAPLTSEQIKQMLPLVEANAEALVKTAGVFSFDAFAIGQDSAVPPRPDQAGATRETTGTAQVEAITTQSLAR